LKAFSPSYTKLYYNKKAKKLVYPTKFLILKEIVYAKFKVTVVWQKFYSCLIPARHLPAIACGFRRSAGGYQAIFLEVP